jgi:glutathione S-transferase
MRQLIHLLLSPPSRLTRLLLGEKRLACELAPAEENHPHLPVFVDIDGIRAEGLWAIVDHLEGCYTDHPMVPEDAGARSEALRLMDWTMTVFHEDVTRKVVYEKASRRFTGAPPRRTPDMNVIRQGRETLMKTLAMVGEVTERRGYLACKECTLADLAMAAHLSALDYFGEVPWHDFAAAAEWYVRMKSRPSFRPLLSDRVPGQPPAQNYAELDF